MRDGCKQLVSSSGGNAGLAAIYCAQELCLPITVVVPETTPTFIVDKMRSEGATVEVVGKVGMQILAARRNELLWCPEISTLALIWILQPQIIVLV